MSGHARLAPSNARWPKCPGSIREEEQYPDIAGAAAIDGTGSHLLLEMCITEAVRPEFYLGRVIGLQHEDSPNGWLVDEARATRVSVCLDYIDRRVAELAKEGYEIKVEAESKSDPGGAFGRDDWKGTVDITISASKDGTVEFIEVIDYKDGRMYVSEKDNSQLTAYLFGKMRPFIASGPELVQPFYASRLKSCRSTIVQPKTNNAIRYVDATALDVIMATRKLADAAHATDKADAPLFAGKHCQWCKASPKRGGHCTASMKKEILPMDIQTIIASDIRTIDADQLTEVMDMKTDMTEVFKRTEAELTRRLNEGIEVPGYAMLPGRSSRVWSQVDELVVKALKNRRIKLADIFPPKLITPAALMKSDLLTDDQKKSFELEYITSMEGKLTLKKVEKQSIDSMVDSISFL